MAAVAAAASALRFLRFQLRRYASSSRLGALHYGPSPSALWQPKGAASLHEEAGGHQHGHGGGAAPTTTMLREAGVVATAARRGARTPKDDPAKKKPKEGKGGRGGDHN
jgi:hypothetical protein